MADPRPSGCRLWQTGGGDNARQGLFAGAVRLDLQSLRRLEARGAVQASVVFDTADRAFVADMAGGVQAFALRGRPLWRTQLEGSILATLAVDGAGARLFAGTTAGWVYSLRTPNGGALWRKAIPSKSDPRILSDLLYLPKQKVVVMSSWGGRFYALDAASGEPRYSWDAGLSPYAGAAADTGDRVYCLRAVRDEGVQFVRVTTDGKETILYRQAGSEKEAGRAMVAAAPVLNEARARVCFILNSGRESLLHAWSSETEAMLWSQRFSSAVRATPTILPDGGVLVADLAGYVHALAPDGTPRYRYASGCEYLLSGSVCDQTGTAYIGDPLGMVHCLSADGLGNPVFEAPRAIQARPSFDRLGNLYVASTDRQVYVFRNQTRL